MSKERTFYLQDSSSGLFLTSLEDSDSVGLKDVEFSINQVWYWSKEGTRLICGNGKVMGGQYGSMIQMSSWPYSSDKQLFSADTDTSSLITISHQGRFLANTGDNKIGMVPSEGDIDPSKFRQHPTDEGYHWEEADESKELHVEAFTGDTNSFFGRSDRDGTLHMGMISHPVRGPRDHTCYQGFHNEDLLSVKPLYLQHESGLYLTNKANENYLELTSLDFSPMQTWWWKKAYGKYIFRCATGNLLSCQLGTEGPAVVTNAYSEDDTYVFFSSEELEGGNLFIKNQSEDGTMFVGVKEMYGKQMATLGHKDDGDMQFKWKAVPVEQAYEWSAMNSSELPKSAICAGKSEDGEHDVFIGRGQVNGKLHLGKTYNGKRYIGYKCRLTHDYKHCNHCCNRENCQVSENRNEDNIREVETESFSVLCIEEGAEWIEFPQSTPPPFNAYSYDWSIFPKSAVIGGINSGILHYVGRGQVDGKMTTGFFSPSYKDTKMIAFHEGKIHQVEGFEMLVVNKSEIDVVTKQNINDHQVTYHGIDNIATEVNGEKFSILCIDVDAAFEWVQYEEDNLPKAAVLAGIYNDNAFFIGRGRVQDQFLLGMFLPRRTMKYSDEDLPHKLYVINKEDMKIHHVEKFEVLVCKPPAWKLYPDGEEQADKVACSYKTLEDISPDNLEDHWEDIKAAIRVELKKGTIKLAKRRDVN